MLIMMWFRDVVARCGRARLPAAGYEKPDPPLNDAKTSTCLIGSLAGRGPVRSLRYGRSDSGTVTPTCPCGGGRLRFLVDLQIDRAWGRNIKPAGRRRQSRGSSGRGGKRRGRSKSARQSIAGGLCGRNIERAVRGAGRFTPADDGGRSRSARLWGGAARVSAASGAGGPG